VRHWPVVTVAAVALIGLGGCSDRPMNLETYYDDPTTPAAPRIVAPPPVAEVAPKTPSRVPFPLARPVTQAVFTATDLVGEGVSPSAPEGEVTGCLASLPAVESPELLHSGDWRYPSGSVLTHQVAGYAAQEGAAVLAALRCTGQTLSLSPISGIDAQRGWCDGPTCTILLAKGHLVSAVRVTASTATRASDAAKRLAKVAAAKLTATQP
jgi:hypothetical protein